MKDLALRLALPALVCLTAGLVTPRHADAQVVREAQVPVDSVRGIVEIGSDLRRDLGLFPEVAGFQVARLYDIVGGGTVLEITWRENGRTLRERRTLTAADLAGLRSRIAEGLQARGMARAVTSEGRGGLVLAETALGLGFYGWAVPTAFDIGDDKAILAAYLLTAGASFYIPYSLTRSRTVTETHRDATVFGGTRGIIYGLLLGDMLTMGDDDEFDDIPGGPSFPENEAERDERVIVGLGMATSIAGSVLGFRAIDPTRHDRGDVALWSTGHDFGLAWAFGLAVATGLYDGEQRCDIDFCYVDDTEGSVVGHLVTTAGGLGSLYLSTRWARARDYTVGDARALLSFGLLGAHVALAPTHALVEDRGSDKDNILILAAVAGSAGALWAGDRVLVPESLTPGEGLLVQAGHLAGAAIAGGLTYLFDDSDDFNESLYLATTAAGAVTGSLLTFRALARGRSASQGSNRGSGDAVRADGTTGPTVEVSAAGLWAPLLGAQPGRTVRVPVVTIRH